MAEGLYCYQCEQAYPIAIHPPRCNEAGDRVCPQCASDFIELRQVRSERLLIPRLQNSISSLEFSLCQQFSALSLACACHSTVLHEVVFYKYSRTVEGITWCMLPRSCFSLDILAVKEKSRIMRSFLTPRRHLLLMHAGSTTRCSASQGLAITAWLTTD